MWIAEDMKCKFIRHDPTKIGGNFEAYINRTQSVRIPGTDMCLVWVPNGGDWKDLSRYLPLTRFTSAPARFIFKAEEGEIVKQNGKPPRVKWCVDLLVPLLETIMALNMHCLLSLFRVCAWHHLSRRHGAPPSEGFTWPAAMVDLLVLAVYYLKGSLTMRLTNCANVLEWF
jgi:hypothetical protein